MALSVPSTSGDKKKSELGRKKMVLGPGRSLIDWIRLSNSGRLSTHSPMASVSTEELQKHDKTGDCWVVLYGMVYDVSAYLEFHPGGGDELIRAAGTDATELFDENHQWVNYKSMLESCLIGPFTGNRAELRPPKPAISGEDGMGKKDGKATSGGLS